jgi:hypothetical protein
VRDVEPEHLGGAEPGEGHRVRPEGAQGGAALEVLQRLSGGPGVPAAGSRRPQPPQGAPPAVLDAVRPVRGAADVAPVDDAAVPVLTPGDEAQTPLGDARQLGVVVLVCIRRVCGRRRAAAGQDHQGAGHVVDAVPVLATRGRPLGVLEDSDVVGECEQVGEGCCSAHATAADEPDDDAPDEVAPDDDIPHDMPADDLPALPAATASRSIVRWDSWSATAR